MTPLGRDDCVALDARDTPGIAALQSRFAPGAEGTLYFDAGSIGPMPASVPARMQEVLDAGWRIGRRRGWNEADWLEQPRRIGTALAPLLGAGADDLAVCDSTSVNLYKLLRQALAIAAPRATIVLERAVFPTDRYVAEGIAHAGLAQLRFIDGPAELERALVPGDVAVVALSHVDYRSSERFDLKAVSQLARRHGALTLWDLSHSAGAVRIELGAADVDFAVSCGYKYLCGGPGAPSILYVNPRWRDAAWPAICGWMGHADTFAFEERFRPAAGPARHLVGSPPVLADAAFAAAAEIWRDADPVALDRRHRCLGDTLIALVEQRCAGFGLSLQSAREHARRGGHVAFRFEAAHALVQALAEAGVIVSSRAPDTLRFGLHPIVTRYLDLWEAVERLRALLESGAWRNERFRRKIV